MKQAHELARSRIDTGDVGAFVEIAMGTGQRKIALNRFAAVLLGPYVINLEGQRECELRNPTVLASPVSSLSDIPS